MDNEDEKPDVELDKYEIHEQIFTPYYSVAKFRDLNTDKIYYIIPSEKYSVEQQLMIIAREYNVQELEDLDLVSVKRHKRKSTTFRAPEYTGGI